MNVNYGNSACSDPNRGWGDCTVDSCQRPCLLCSSSPPPLINGGERREGGRREGEAGKERGKGGRKEGKGGGEGGRVFIPSHRPHPFQRTAPG